MPIDRQTEIDVLREVIRMYRESPCLWDPNHVGYNTKHHREKAMKLILKKYRDIDENATIDMLRKKIDHLRTAYRRELKKVIKAKENGKEYSPTLWYFRHLSFLNNVITLTFNSSTYKYLETEELELSDNENDNTQVNMEEESIFIAEHDDNDSRPNFDEDDPTFAEDEPTFADNKPTFAVGKATTSSASPQAEAFGKSVGLQLGGMSPMQRIIAEKLISDVIFYGKLEKLTTNSTINISD